MKILIVIGARPQFIKHAPLEIAAKGRLELVTIHTGQHYDNNMSQIFFDQLKIEKPDYMLSIGGGNHGEQTGRMLQEIEPILLHEGPDYLLVYGDTNSTLAGALAASKLNIPVIHVEAGLRSFNKRMPEEINRILTDHISALLFTSTDSAIKNLENEGIRKGVHKLGDIMADSVDLAVRINKEKEKPFPTPYYYVTIHRPYNTDDKLRMVKILSTLNHLDKQIIFPIHPRTKKQCEDYGVNFYEYSNVKFIEPVSYFDNINYLKNADHAITDSGGMQKEAYILKIPCITLRSETEWVETLSNNWNILCFENVEDIQKLIYRELGGYIEDVYGNGNAATEIIDLILEQK